MVGVPVIINHKDITDKNADEERVGVVNSVWYDNKDGWYWCDGIIWNETAQNLITDKNWSVSCSYNVKTADNEGGSENNIKYDMEFLDGVFTHLALVNNPRYERANIVFNGKPYNPDQPRDEEGKWTTEGNAEFILNNIEPVKISSSDIPIFTNKYDRTPLTNYVREVFKANRDLIIKSNDRKILLSRNGADRTSAKQNINDTKHNAVYTKIKEVVERAEYFKTVPPKESRIGKIKEQEIYLSKMEIDDIPYAVKISVDVPLDEFENGTYNYAGHRVSEIKITSARKGVGVDNNQLLPAETDVTIIITDEDYDFNPSVIDNSKEQDMTLLEKIKELIRTVENEKGDDMDDKEKKEIDNEKVDKRKLIDEVGGILKGKVDDEIIRTIIKKMEEASYNESEDGAADNKKVKNEDDKDDKEEVKNKKVKNEEEEDKEEDKKEVKEVKEDVKEDVDNKCNNSKVDFFDKMNKIYNSALKPDKSETEYVSRADRLKAGEEYFKV